MYRQFKPNVFAILSVIYKKLKRFQRIKGKLFSLEPFKNVRDPVGIQTQDLQNRNLTLYSAKLRDQNGCKDTYYN